MMGMFDCVEIAEGVEFPESVPRDIEWQTKTFPKPIMRVYKITEGGKLLEEEFEFHEVPEEDRPMYDEKIGGFEKEFHKALGMLNKETTGWTEKDYHGMMEIHGSQDEIFYSLELKFTDGKLESIEVKKP